ncbi:MAG: hypothetical protein AAFZ52_14135, partial [Bacteroidota bacterium]
MSFHHPWILRTHQLISCLLLILAGAATLPAQNALRFTGTGDYLNLPVTGSNLEGSTTFTLEFWFRADPATCTPSFARALLALTDNTNTLYFSLCGNELRLTEGDGSPATLPLPITTATAGDWHVLRVDHFPGQTQIRLDCFLYPTTNFSLPDGLQRAFVGRALNNLGADLSFSGEIDQLQLRSGPWPVANNFCVTEYCVPPADAVNMFAYYDFNQGAAAGAGNGIGAVLDRSPNGNDANLFNFDLPATNPFVPSTAPILGEGLPGLAVNIRDYTTATVAQTEICSGDPVHFCLGSNGPPPGLLQPVAITWEFSDDAGATWTTLTAPPFTDYCFPVLPEVLTIDCANNPQGFVDRFFRAQMTVADDQLGQSCTYYSETDTLRIRYPLTDVSVSIDPNAPVCAGDELNLTVNLLTT